MAAVRAGRMDVRSAAHRELDANQLVADEAVSEPEAVSAVNGHVPRTGWPDRTPDRAQRARPADHRRYTHSRPRPRPVLLGVNRRLNLIGRVAGGITVSPAWSSTAVPGST